MPQNATSSRTQPAGNWRVEHVPELDGFAVEWAHPKGQLLVSRGPHLFSCKPNEAPWHVGTVPQGLWQWIATQTRPEQRPTHALFNNVIPLNGRVSFVSYGRDVYAMRDGIVRPLRGLVRRTRVVRGGCALTADGSLYFAEYHTDHLNGASHIYCWKPGWTQAEIAYTFAKRTIRHIHGIYSNPYDKSLWCLTGDERGECRILRSDDGFSTLEVVGAGDHSWKAISIQFTSDFAYYAMSADSMHNKIMQIDWRSGKRREVGEVNGPVNYSLAIGNEVFFAVMAKACKSQKDGQAALWLLDAQVGLRRLAAHGRGRWQGRPLRPGSLRLSQGGHELDRFWFTGTGLDAAGSQTYQVVKT